MSAPYGQAVFLGYLEGDLGPEDLARFEQILINDVRLRNLVAQLVGDRQKLHEIPREQAPPELMERISQRLEHQVLLDDPDVGRVAVAELARWGRRLAYGGVAAMSLVSATVVVLVINQRLQIRRTDQASSQSLVQRTGEVWANRSVAEPPVTAAIQPQPWTGDVLASRPTPDVPKQSARAAKMPSPLLANAKDVDTDAISIIDDPFLELARTDISDDANVDGELAGPTEPDALVTPDYLHEFNMAEAGLVDRDQLIALDEPLRGDAEEHRVTHDGSPLSAVVDIPKDKTKLPRLGAANTMVVVPVASERTDKSGEPTAGWVAEAPPTWIEVFSLDTAAAKRQLLNWAKARSTSAKAADPAKRFGGKKASATTRKSSPGEDSKAPLHPAQVFMVKIPADQLPDSPLRCPIDRQRARRLASGTSIDAKWLISVAVVIRSQRQIEEVQDVLHDSQKHTD